MWGNDKSLRKLPQKVLFVSSNTLQRMPLTYKHAFVYQAGIDIRNLLSKFYNEHYKPENMCAVIRGPHSIDELQVLFCWAIYYFL